MGNTGLGLALILTPAERSALAGNLAGEIRWAGNVRDWLEFAEAIARSRDQDLRRTYVSEVARALEPIALETKAEAIVENEHLAWWANAERASNCLSVCSDICYDIGRMSGSRYRSFPLKDGETPAR